MRNKGPQRMETEEILKLRVGDKVWFCPWLIIPNNWDGKLERGTITEIIRPSNGKRCVMLADLLPSLGNVQCFIIDEHQVPPLNIFKD